VLVAPNERGAVDLVRGLEGATVKLEGAVMSRDGVRMIEIAGSPQVTAPCPDPASPDAPPPPSPFELATCGPGGASTGASPPAPVNPDDRLFVGEIVDSRCYLEGKSSADGAAHRACAERCMTGGIPAALVLREESGATTLLLLADAAGQPVGSAAIPFAGARVQIRGRMTRMDDLPLLLADPATYTIVQAR
jgi:hypothetical protein